MKPEKNMGDLFRGAFNDFEKKPSDKVWNNIENAVKAPNIGKTNFFKPANLIVGSAAIVVLSVILYFILPFERAKSIQPQAVYNQKIENKTLSPIENEQNEVVLSTKTSNNIETKANSKNDNGLINNNSQKNTSKKQNIIDLIAQIDNNQTSIENNTKHNAVNTTVVAKTNNANSNQKIVDTQQPTRSNNIVSKNIPIAQISFSPDQTICKGEKVTLSVNGGASYLWSTGENTQFIIVSPTSSTDYSVIATDENGNRKAGLISVTVSDCNAPFIPTAFSPNGNGQSAVFKVYGNGITKFEIIIVSRSGQIVYTSKNMNEGWDGSIKGNQAPMGVYVYTIKYTNELNIERTITGHVTLIR